MRKRNLSIVLLILIMVVACASFTKNAYRGLVVSEQSYDATLSAMGDLYKEGKVTEAQKNKAITLGRAYKDAHNDSVGVLTVYERNGGTGSTDAVTAAIEKASTALADLIAYCRPFLEGGN